MTVEETIKELESLSSEKMEKANRLDNIVNNKLVVDMCDVDLIEATLCRKKANDYIQISEWLKELKRHREAWMKVVSEIDQHTDIHSDGELYVKNFDVKKIIAEYRPKEGDAE